MDPRPVSLSEVVRRAAQIVDPDDEDAVVGDFQQAFEDADEPVAGLDDVQERVAEVLSRLDPAVNNGSLSVAGAVAVYLSYRRDELHEDPRELIRLAARAEWNEEPPGAVTDWLDDHNVTP
ncbi:MAG: hypothetical protein ACRDPM_05685 [Solirubrobacteraceae bacterium]